MLTVTSSAKEKLKADLEKDRDNEASLARVVYDPANPARIGFTMDREKEGDQVILDDDGKKLLLIGQDMVPVLKDMVLDYDKALNENEFLITKV